MFFAKCCTLLGRLFICVVQATFGALVNGLRTASTVYFITSFRHMLIINYLLV